MPPTGTHSTTARAALAQATLALVHARPNKQRTIRAAQQLLLRGLTPLDDGAEFADGVIVRRPSGACTHPPCQAQITCVHELAFQLLQDVPQLLVAPTSGAAPAPKGNEALVQASCLACRRVFAATDLAAHWAHHRPETVRRVWTRAAPAAVLPVALLAAEPAAEPAAEDGVPCRRCGLVLADRMAWYCHVTAEHTKPEEARTARLLFIKHRHALSQHWRGAPVAEEVLCSTPS
jgi:hypothetical protein